MNDQNANRSEQTSELIEPYGGQLVNLIAPREERKGLLNLAATLPRIQLLERRKCRRSRGVDVELNCFERDETILHVDSSDLMGETNDLSAERFQRTCEKFRAFNPGLASQSTPSGTRSLLGCARWKHSVRLPLEPENLL